MLVKHCMTRHPIMIPPTTPVTEAEQIMMENKIQCLPVVGDGKRLLGMINRQRLALKPDTMASLNVWEITRYLSNLTVQQLMLKVKEVHTIGPNKTIERAARCMMEYELNCLPVVEEANIVVGLLTQLDVLRSFQEMLGLPAEGVRITVRIPDQPGEFSRLTGVLNQYQWGVMGIGTFPSHKRPGYYDVVIKIPRVAVAEVEQAFSEVSGHEIIDVQTEV